MFGGTGVDQFFFIARTDSGVGVGVRDVISDFSIGEDRLNLKPLNANAEMISFTSIAAGKGVVVGIDFDLNGSVDFQIQMNNAAGLSLSDIVL